MAAAGIQMMGQEGLFFFFHQTGILTTGLIYTNDHGSLEWSPPGVPFSFSRAGQGAKKKDAPIL